MTHASYLKSNRNLPGVIYILDWEVPQRSEGSPILEQHEVQSPDACTSPT